MLNHFEVQKREDICRGLAERMKFVLSDLRAEENVFNWQEDPSKIQQGRNSGKWLKVDIVAIKEALWQLLSTGSTIFRTNISNLSNFLDTLDLEEVPDSRERTGAPVLWLCCEGQADAWEMFSDNSHLSAILD